MTKISRRWTLVSLVIMSLLVAGGWWLSGHLHKRVIDAGLTKKAQANPWLATDKLLQQWDKTTHTEHGLQLLKHEGRLRQLKATLLLTHVYAQLSPTETQHLLHWVHQGGQVIVAVDNAFVGLDKTLKTPLMDALGVTVTKQKKKPTKAQSKPKPALKSSLLKGCRDDADTATVHLGQAAIDFVAHSKRLLKLTKGPLGAQLRLKAKDKQGIRLLQFAWGKGAITLLPSATIWHNRFLSCHDHAYLLWALVTPNDGLMVVDNNKTPSLWGTLWQHGWLALVIAVLSILLWLWRASRRFGPIHYQLIDDEPDLQQHLQASGWFLWRHRAQQPLVDAVRQQVIDLATQRIQGFRQAGRQQRLRLLAERSQYSKGQLRRLLYQQSIERKHFVSLIAELQQLKDQL